MWIPQDGETLGKDVSWDEIEEYFAAQKELMHVIARHMVKSGKNHNNFYVDKGIEYGKVIRKYDNLWNAWDAHGNGEDIFAGLEEDG